MAVIKLKIDKVEYDIQCKNGEEPILREIETQINKIICRKKKFLEPLV